MEAHEAHEAQHQNDMETTAERSLRDIAAHVLPDVEPEDGERAVDVRLQLLNGEARILWGSPQYDTDHRGFWGAGILTESDASDDNAMRALARDLVNEALDHKAESE